MGIEKDNKEIRTLEEICDLENFSIKIIGNTYCGLGVDKKINCEKQAKEKDKNGCYPCLDLRKQQLKNSYNIKNPLN